MYAICALACVIVTNDVQPAQPDRVARILLLHSFGREFAPFSVFAGHFRTDLARQSPTPVDFYDVSLESARFDEPPQEGPFLNYLQSLFAGRRADLVVTIGGPAARFAQTYRRRLFPSTPMLIAAVDQRNLQTAALTANDAVVAVRIDPAAVIEKMLQVLPATTTVAVVLGSSPLEKFWLDQLRRDLIPFNKRIDWVWFNQLSFAEMRERAAALPPHAAIFYGQLTMDAAGVPHEEERALAELYAVADAPIFGLFDYQLGRGIVGGPLISLRELSEKTANVAVRLLQGEVPAIVRTAPMGAGRSVYDWRELERWGIKEERLPSGSVVQFRQPTIWQQYKWYVAGVVALCLAQAALISGLLIQRRRRHRVELELQANRDQLAHVTRLSTAGELTASVAHELNQPLGAILSNAEAAEMFLNTEPPALDEVRDILADIRKDDQRASEVIRRMRSLLRKQEMAPKSIAINEAVEEVLRLLSTDAAVRKVAMKFERTADLPRVWCDPVHFQQVVLNLVLNGMEVMAGLPEEKRQVVIRTGRGNNGTVKVAVADSGPGIPLNRLPKLFDPFFTTKKEGMGMGLAIARTIIEAHHGQIWAENNSGVGATFYFTVPVDKGPGGTEGRGSSEG
jgi:signal transduction histidine kinase